MNRIALLIFGLLLWCEPAQADQAAPYGRANAAQIHGYIVLLRLRGDLFDRWKATGQWPDDKAANAALDAHGKYWEEQLKNGHVLMTGAMDGDYWDNVAEIVLEAASTEEAKSIAANDPAVKAYVFQAQVRPFNVFSLTNRFDSKFTPTK